MADVDEAHPLIKGLRWILANRTTTPMGERMNRRQLSIAAELTAGHVEQILAGRIKPGGVSGDVVRALARAGNVRTNWLLTAEEPREPYEGDAPGPSLPERTVELDARYQHLETVINYQLRTRPDRWSKATIEAARSIALESDEDPSNEEWEARLDALEATVRGLRRGRAAGTPVKATDEDRPPRGRKK